MGKYCGKCGKPKELCRCDGEPGKWTRPRADFKGCTVLGNEECFVRAYELGRYPFDSGKVSLTITNKRVILKEKYKFLFFEHNSIDELNLESVRGISGTNGRAVNPLLLLIGLGLLGTGIFRILVADIFAPYGVHQVNGGPFFAIGLLLTILSCIFPYMTFGITGMVNDRPVLSTSIHVIGKLGLSKNIFFQPRPCKNAQDIFSEASACIMDLRIYGDEAMVKWRNV